MAGKQPSGEGLLGDTSSETFLGGAFHSFWFYWEGPWKRRRFGTGSSNM
jgi:hypothetical protein